MPPENPHKTTDTAGQTPLGAMRRRTVITGAAGVGVGAVAGASAHALLSPPRSDMSVPGRKPADIALTDATAGFYGEHQQGIATESQAHARFIAIDLNENLHAEAIQRLLRILTNDAAALTRGTAPLTDQEPELAQVSANLTVTIGFGSRIFDIAAPEKKPGWLAPLPAFPAIDKLQDAYTGGDLLLQLCCDDLTVLSHAQRMLTKDTRSFGRIRWVQNGFLRAFGAGTGTPRNLFGTPPPTPPQPQDAAAPASTTSCGAKAAPALVTRRRGNPAAPPW